MSSLRDTMCCCSSDADGAWRVMSCCRTHGDSTGRHRPHNHTPHFVDLGGRTQSLMVAVERMEASAKPPTTKDDGTCYRCAHPLGTNATACWWCDLCARSAKP